MSCVSKHQTPLWLPELYDIVAPVVWAAWDLLLTGMIYEAARCDTQGLLGLVLAHWLEGSWDLGFLSAGACLLAVRPWGLATGLRDTRAGVSPPVESVIWKEPREDLPDDLEFLRKAGGNCSSPVGHRNCQQSFWGAFSTTWPLGLASKILESSL